MKKNHKLIACIISFLYIGLSSTNLYAQLLPIRQFDHPDWDPNEHVQIMHVDFSKDGKRFLSCGLWNTVFLWDMEQGVLLRQYPSTSEWILKCAFSPDEKYIAAYGDNWNLNVWNADNAELIGKTILKHDKYATTGNRGPLMFSTDSKKVMVIINGSPWNYFDLDTKYLKYDENLITCYYDERGVLDLGDGKRKYIKDKQILFDLNEKGVEAVKNAKDMYYEIPDEQTGNEFAAPIVSMDNKYVLKFISYYRNFGKINVWDIALNFNIYTSPEIDFLGYSCSALSPNNQYLLIGKDENPDYKTRIVNIKTGEIVKTLDLKEGMLGYNDKVSHAKFTPDGKYALICVDETAYLYDVSDLNTNIKSDSNF